MSLTAISTHGWFVENNETVNIKSVGTFGWYTELSEVLAGFLSGNIVGTSHLAARIENLLKVYGSIDGQSSYLGTLRVLSSLIGEITGTTFLVADLQILLNFIGTITGESDGSARLRILVELISAINSQSELTADLSILEGLFKVLAGEIAGQSGGAGYLRLFSQIGGTIVGYSDSTGELYSPGDGTLLEFINYVKPNDFRIKYIGTYKDRKIFYIRP